MTLTPRWQPGILPLSGIIAALAISTVAVGMLMHVAVLGISISHRLATATAPALLLIAIILFRFRSPRTRWERVLRDGTESMSMFAGICLIGALATYPVAAESSGFADASLERIDRLVQFDWVALYAFVATHHAVQLSERLAYESIFFTPAVLLAYFAVSDRMAEARLLIASFWLAATLTVLLFGFIPAEGPLAYLWHGPIPYLPETAFDQANLIPALRAHHIHIVDLGHLRGIVAAPSFHAASAVLYTLIAWPVARIRWPACVLNAAMLAATPIEGAHYLVDLVGGAMVAGFSFLVVMTIARSPEWRTARALPDG